MNDKPRQDRPHAKQNEPHKTDPFKRGSPVEIPANTMVELGRNRTASLIEPLLGIVSRRLDSQIMIALSGKAAKSVGEDFIWVERSDLQA